MLAVERLDLADGELVADEEVLRRSTPSPPCSCRKWPPHHFSNSRNRGALGVDLRVEVVELGPVGVRRVEALEVVDEVGAVELAVAEVAGQRGQPRCRPSARPSSASGSCRRRPPSRRSASRRAGSGRPSCGRERGEHHQRPAALAVADDERLALGVRVQLVHLAQELRPRRARPTRSSGPAPAPGRTSRSSRGDRRLQRDADLAVDLEAADARAVAGARIDHHERALLRVGRGWSAGGLMRTSA